MAMACCFVSLLRISSPGQSRMDGELQPLTFRSFRCFQPMWLCHDNVLHKSFRHGRACPNHCWSMPMVFPLWWIQRRYGRTGCSCPFRHSFTSNEVIITSVFSLFQRTIVPTFFFKIENLVTPFPKALTNSELWPKSKFIHQNCQ